LKGCDGRVVGGGDDGRGVDEKDVDNGENNGGAVCGCDDDGGGCDDDGCGCDGSGCDNDDGDGGDNDGGSGGDGGDVVVSVITEERMKSFRSPCIE